MKRGWLFALAALLTFVAAPMASAANPYGKFLPPDKAFQLSAHPRAHSVVLDWQIHDGYYLYLKKFKVAATHGKIGKAQFPPGKMKNDPNFGKVEVFRREVRAKVPVTKIPSDDRVALTVTYQGCADAGLCYPPITKHLHLRLKQGGAQAAGGGSTVNGGAGGAGAAGSGPTSTQSAQGHLASLVQHANPLWFVAVFFALGVLLAFTPCILPMVPILAGVLGKDRAGGARRGFALSLIYVLAMAAVYTGAGVAAGFAGTSLQGFFQTPWIIALFAAVFVALALSLFGLYELRIPAAVTNRLTLISANRSGTSFFGAGAMGALAALVVSPCIAAPIAGALIAIGQAGVPARGAIALAALSLGMGTPLLVYGTVAGKFLPKAGRWMGVIEKILGVAMLAYAIWLLGRILPAPVILVLWGALGLLTAFLLGVFKRPFVASERGLARGAGALVGLAGLVLIVGGATGGASPLAPFAGFRAMPRAEAMALNYHPVTSVASLKTQLARAAKAGRPTMIEFRADWCTACLDMEHTTFKKPAVHQALSKMTLLKVDVTDNTPAERKLLKHFGLYGPPAYLFFDRCGRPLHAQDVVGYLAANKFLPHVHTALEGVAAARAVADRDGLHCASASTSS
jgi:thiol:disulfide interchange protein DsbD